MTFTPLPFYVSSSFCVSMASKFSSSSFFSPEIPPIPLAWLLAVQSVISLIIWDWRMETYPPPHSTLESCTGLLLHCPPRRGPNVRAFLGLNSWLLGGSCREAHCSRLHHGLHIIHSLSPSVWLPCLAPTPLASLQSGLLSKAMLRQWWASSRLEPKWAIFKSSSQKLCCDLEQGGVWGGNAIRPVTLGRRHSLRSRRHDTG